MSEHTPGKWRVRCPIGIETGQVLIHSDHGSRVHPYDHLVAVCDGRHSSIGNAIANTQRIVACVNACEGIEDPEKTVAAMVKIRSIVTNRLFKEKGRDLVEDSIRLLAEVAIARAKGGQK